MKRKGDGLRYITEAFGGLDGLVDAVCEASPQARRHYGLVDQVDSLVRASENDPEPGFIARWLMLRTLPRSNPGNREKYVRRNDPYTLVMTVGHPHKLPFGSESTTSIANMQRISRSADSSGRPMPASRLRSRSSGFMARSGPPATAGGGRESLLINTCCRITGRVPGTGW